MGLFSTKMPFEKRDRLLMDFVNGRLDWIGAHLFEIVSSVLDPYEFDFES